MKIHIEQKFDLSEITPYRNFSLRSFEPNKNSFFLKHLKLTSKEKSKRKNTKYFYYSDSFDDPNGSFIPLEHFTKRVLTFITRNKKHIKKYNNDPFAKVINKYFFRSIKESDEKIHISLNTIYYEREVNCVFFKKKYFKRGLVINKKTGDFYIYHDGSVKKNHFKKLYNFLCLLFIYEHRSRINTLHYLKNKEIVFHNVREQFNRNFNDLEFINKFEDIIGVERSENVDNILRYIITFFVEKKKIKIPNKFEYYILHYYPTKKHLKRNDNKLIASILDKYGIKSKSLIKMLHGTPTFNILLYQQLSLLVNKNRLNNINDKIFTHVSQSDDKVFWLGDYRPELTDNQQKTFIKILNTHYDKIDKHKCHDVLDEIVNFILRYYDHIRMYLKLVNTPFEVDLKAEDIDTFTLEHKLLTDNLNKLKKSLKVDILFSEDFIKTVQTPMRVLSDDMTINEYYPVLLKNSDDYYYEGKHMSHCVSTYVDKNESIIVSIRKESIDGYQRVTCEYSLKTKQLRQCRSFCNYPIPSEFEVPVKLLSEKIGDYFGDINVNRNFTVINGVNLDQINNNMVFQEQMHIF